MNGRVAQESRVPADETDGRTDPVTGKNGKDTNGHAANGKASAAKADVPVAEVPVAEAHWSERPIGRVDVPPLGEFTTPVRVDEIAVAAMALSENLDAATRGMPESVALREFRRELDQAASTFRTLAGSKRPPEASSGSLRTTVSRAVSDGESALITASP
ncbi:hypothetical protein GCM10029976_097710 [Kribbella albertanoniae]